MHLFIYLFFGEGGQKGTRVSQSNPTREVKVPRASGKRFSQLFVLFSLFVDFVYLFIYLLIHVSLISLRTYVLFCFFLRGGEELE